MSLESPAPRIYPASVLGLAPRANGVNLHYLGCNALCSGDIHATIAFRRPALMPATLLDAQRSVDTHHAKDRMPDVQVLSVEEAMEHPPDSREGYTNGWMPYLMRWRYRMTEHNRD